MKKRLISMLLCVAMLVTSVPVSALAKDTNSQTTAVQASTAEEHGIDYKMNGGAFVAGYEAPDTYPVSSLPTMEQIEKTGYEFAGWYDNEAFEGDAITSLNDSDYSGNIVLYAKWKDRYYYVDIPQTITANGDNLTITAKACGLYDRDYVNVTVQSENDWKLKSGLHTLQYELRDKADNMKFENNAVITSLTAENRTSEKELYCNILEKPHYTGNYTDQLTFDVSFTETSYTIQYETNGGTMVQNSSSEDDTQVARKESYPAGTVLNQLPQPVKKSATFLGWCYDEECTDYVDSRDRLLSDVTLYASYTDTQPLETKTMATFARAIDAGTDFTIQITDKSGKLTADQLRTACQIKNVSDSSESITLTVTEGADHIFTVGTANPAGWKPGSAYKLTLKNDSLYFTGNDQTIREYDFTIFKADVSNVSLNNEIKYIPIKDLKNLTVNGQAASEVSVAVMTVGMDGSVTGEGSDTKGTFTYEKQTLNVGDQIAVYSGDVIPTMNLTSGSDSDVSFFEITAVNGTTYSYRGSDAEDVLFMPDVLPLDQSKDLDGDPNNNSVTVPVSELTFGDDAMSQALELDDETTVDVGDFLALYTNVNSGTPVYGKITSVDVSGSDYIINYDTVTWDDVQAAMDVYRTEHVEGDDLLEETDRQQLENDVETQAQESGFADEVVQRIAKAAMQTQSFEELEQSLSEDMNAQISVQSNGVGNLARAGQKPQRVTAELDHVKANLSTTLKHFDGNISGLHLALNIGVKITIKAGSNANIEIMVNATFEQEVRIDINVNGEAVWKVWGIFPYIADYRVTASLELYEYTGIGLDVNFKLTEQDGGSNQNTQKKNKLLGSVTKITEELKNMMENGESVVSDGGKFSLDSGSGDEISVSRSLAERYSELLADESDWVEIYKRQLTNHHFRVLLIIDIEIQLDFVVSANVNVSLGMTYWYKNAKRYVFCVRVKDRTATSDTIDLCEEQYEFTAYAMGTLGIKAGVRLTVRVGLISTALASVGISADVGGYAQVWGYLYYELKYAASTGRETRAMGALYLEIGIYLEIKFQAQALANSFTYSPTLYENQWPLYTVGRLDNVLDFNYTQDSIKPIRMKRDIQSYQLPDDYFIMQYMDMKTGLDENGAYYKKYYEDDAKHFSIVMTNKAFSYDSATNIIRVDPGSEPEQDGEMIITWKNQEGSFNTKPATRKITLHWDNLRDGYYIAFQSNGGSYVDPITGKYNTDVEKPEDPVRQGYKFAGWYTDETLTTPYTIPKKMPNDDALVFAKWEADDVNYTVVDYVEGTNGVYEAQSSDVYKGKTDSEVSPQPKERSGFVTPPQLTAAVQADGSTVINYYYARQEYTVKFVSDGETISEGTYKYGSMMPTPAVYKPGYAFKKWDISVPETVPAQDMTYNAVWEASDGIPYVVKYYIQNTEDDGYTLSEIQTFTGKTGEEVTAADAGYNQKIYHLKDTLPKGTIKADGSLVLKVYYDRNSYQLHFDPSGGTLDQAEQVVTARPGEQVNLPLPTRTGYTFEGWYLDQTFDRVFSGRMPEADTTVYAKWDKQKVSYTVQHYVENLAAQDYMDRYSDGPAVESPATFDLKTEEVLQAYADEKVTPEVKHYVGFTSPEKAVITINGDGSTVVKYYYTRNSHMLKLKLNEKNKAEDGSEGDMEDEAVIEIKRFDVPIKIKPIWAGYEFLGWYTDKEKMNVFTGNMPDADLTLYAKWNRLMVPYKVQYYLEDLNASDNRDPYSLKLEETHQALAESEVTPEVKEFEGFTYQKPEEGMDKWLVYGTGDAVIRYDYTRNSYDVTFVEIQKVDGVTADQTTVEKLPYESKMTYVPKRAGYAFDGWYLDAAYTEPFTTGIVPAENLTLYAKWEFGKKDYQVQHRLQDLDGSDNYEVVETENFIGTAGEEITPETKVYEGFTAPEKTTYTLKVDDETDVFTYDYTRNQYQVTFVKNNGSEPQNEKLYYGAEIKDPSYDETPNGYTFAGWYTDAALTDSLTEATVPAKDITLYVKWEALEQNYSVSHYLENVTAQNGDDYTLDKVEYFQAKTDEAVTPQTASYTGFTVPDMQTVTVKAGDHNNFTNVSYYYNRNVHQLTLYANDGTNAKTTSLKYGAAIEKPYRSGYSFEGWYTDENCQNIFSGTMPDADLTLYGKWEANKVNYVVEHWIQRINSTVYDRKEREILSAKTDMEVTPDVKQYVGFASPEKQTVTVKGDGMTIIYYRYPRKESQITFVLNNGEKDVIQTGQYGSSVKIPTPVREGYSFVGWNQEIPDTMPAENATYTAQWKKNNYVIRYNTNGGNAIAEQVLAYGDKIVKPENPVRKGYTFIGWDQEIPDTMPARNLNLTAKWAVETYQISYDLNGGVAKNPTNYDVTSPIITLAEPKRDGYTFLGWKGTDLTGTQRHVAITTGSTGNRSYTAVWEENTYEISFVLTGSGSSFEKNQKMSPIKVTYTEQKKLPKNTMKRTGYTFLGWADSTKATKAQYTDQVTVSRLTTGKKITLYPVWKVNSYKITFDYGDGRRNTEIWCNYGAVYKLPVDVPRYGWTFNGWKLKNSNTVNYPVSGSNKVDRATLQDAENITLHAGWTANNSYSYRPSSSSNSYRVTDKHELTKFTFYVDGNQTAVKTTGDTGQKPARYHINMKDLSYNAVRQTYKSMELKVSYKIKMVDDGYADMRISYRSGSDKKNHEKWQSKTEDIKKKNGKTVSYTFSLNSSDVDQITLEFDAHGKWSDKFDLSNLNVDVTFK